MKKIATLILFLGSVVAVQAQTSRDEARRVILGQPKDGGQSTSQTGRDVILGGDNGRNTYPTNNYPYGNNSSADQVNRDYDAKINSIRNNPYLSNEEKQRAISQLERDRQKRLKAINGNYSKKGRRNDNDDYNDDRKDNGKHLGWEKGKGNPHKGKGKHKD
jgi:hypothetical protein